ncbi:hypothetical protein QQS21_012862 [Conoideocrella luteorostrata]|uniref:Uncharacterized protein n=1 Tax=Conoideocrella luteorostrata TaxID=1105319 RepID=A0AAJ0CEY4_9HYPO|nr:hypothetical protein QQS21_012862 [Conoideocrella luteorostrata]
MTEPENFEEDLFADLYDDNDATKTAPTQVAAAPIVEPPKAEDQNMAANTNDFTQQDATMHQDGEDDEEDDDDVDFNLGGRDNNMAVPAPNQDAGASTPPYGTVHKASAKDDG